MRSLRPPVFIAVSRPRRKGPAVLASTSTVAPNVATRWRIVQWMIAS